MTKEPMHCGRVLGHGLTCQPGYTCGSCKQIDALEAELQVAEEFAIELCTERLQGYDRDGYDLWWEVPMLFPREAAYLLLKGILVGNDEGLVAWKETLDEEPELNT